MAEARLAFGSLGKLPAAGTGARIVAAEALEKASKTMETSAQMMSWRKNALL